jgi:hypothetical protein
MHPCLAELLARLPVDDLRRPERHRRRVPRHR